jgi:hypothetical protein
VTDPSNPDIERIARELASRFQGNLSWKWDRRFETALAEFKVDNKEAIRAILEQDLSVVWDGSTIGNAPDIVRDIEKHFGGLWPGQLLFTSDPKRNALIFGSWWPWGDGKEISLRIGPSYRTLPDSKRDEKVQLFKTWFGVG